MHGLGGLCLLPAASYRLSRGLPHSKERTAKTLAPATAAEQSWASSLIARQSGARGRATLTKAACHVPLQEALGIGGSDAQPEAQLHRNRPPCTGQQGRLNWCMREPQIATRHRRELGMPTRDAHPVCWR